jgi:hypothetical protein
LRLTPRTAKAAPWGRLAGAPGSPRRGRAAAGRDGAATSRADRGAPPRDEPPLRIERVRWLVKILQGPDDGDDRQMVKVLSAVLTDGLAAVEAACADGLADGVHSADVVLNILSKHRDTEPAATILRVRSSGS